MSKQIWRVYTAQGNEVVSTLWTELGPHSLSAVVRIAASADEAAELAVQYQGEYDRTRRAVDA